MDIAAARAALPSMTRSLLGEPATITPMTMGKMKSDRDLSRDLQVGIMARFDSMPDDTALGGGDVVRSRATVGAATKTVSFDRAALSWLPKQGDRVSRGNGDVFEIVRPGEDAGAGVIFWLSEV
ncbi:hypothetical protein [Allorhizobium taibaishanense]|uniref:Uncharacterized protein n=1 Tax=Allorhizobium taibaishanense TaxID=887144 RepID=A0A1Q9A2V1_9HYPH|nr:hypothetical protein [Allorhizobium taibaishanense]MBB4005807.1 hypothetical protein [Allorhizobium taibaishanense]OLP48856.1 hypothetical protein BJF91_17120 [Allorhizobium taibaishanense]